MEIHALFFRQIKNRHGQTLAIMNNGEVRGVAEEAPANKNAVLEFIPTEPPGAYRIRGIQVNLYLAMDEKGKLYGESDRTEGSTIFAEHTQNKVRNTFSIRHRTLFPYKSSSRPSFLWHTQRSRIQKLGLFQEPQKILRASEAGKKK